ncbi:MAG: flippase-like domain-containing protein [Muribaculaceae bacterium]|nr:flippase-like domain-containing protein [Muribaculaceae bacterium]
MAESTAANKSGKKTFSLWKVALPVLIGLGVVAYMFWHDARQEDFSMVWRSMHFDVRGVLCIILGFLCMFGRDFGLTWRFRALTDRQLTWTQAWKVDMLCEFTNCVTPSAVGGSSLGMVFLNTQGIEMGRATTLMLTTLFMDELFFVIACPFIVLFTSSADIFASTGTDFSHGIKYTFWTVYLLITVWTFLLFTGIIWKPAWIKKTLDKISKWRWLRKWEKSISGLGDNMVATSVELRKKPFRFWLEVFWGTALAWTSRYLVVNVLFFGFIPADDRYQWIIFARQFVIWVVLMVSPTPGGAGLSEWLFSEYYGDMVTSAGIALVLAIFWRLISYYLYLLIGAVMVPTWLRKTIARHHNSETAKTISGKNSQ